MGFNNNLIVNAVYISKRQELWIEFQEYIKPSYNCACFVDVTPGAVARMKQATTPNEGFELYIRKKFKYYLTIFELCQVFRKCNYDAKSADDIETPAEYEARLKAEMERLDKEAMKSF